VGVIVTESQVGFDDFVAPHLPAMWVLATRLVGPDAREDVVQEALFTAWRRFSTYDRNRGTPRTWLLVVVADKCRKHWRAARSTAQLVDVPATATDLEAHLDVSRAVGRLPRRQRLAVELFYVLDLPVAECALVMECAVGTVSSTLSDARKALRTQLEVSS
jgi:RNA polymerase sigma factor (sigma-70 family)